MASPLIRLDRWRSVAREGLPSCGLANGSAQACRARTDPPRPSVGPRRLPPFGAARLHSRRDHNVFIFLNWLGDSLDGTLARVRNQQRPRYGFYVDHMADTWGAFALMTGLAVSGYMHWLIAAGMLAAFYVLSIESDWRPIRSDDFICRMAFLAPPRSASHLQLATCC
jgi:hypothetical protein